MRTLSIYYQVSMAVAFIGWLFLFIVPYASYTDTVATTIAVSLAFFYVYILFFKKDIEGEKYPEGTMKTLEGVVNLFRNPRGVLVGWIHFLVFDLMIAMHIKNDALAEGISFWWILPSMILTLMLGPVGFASYVILKLVV